jgi:cellulose synthase/poly-beta-1,6-N-acetylglucosamine synthase-like glycosyltransferase
VSRAPATDPVVSVVVPIRNGADTIGECIEALLANDYPPERREILVVDNASSDGTAEIIRRYAVTYLRAERPGVSHARNRGIEASRGELVAFLDGDCVAEPSWLTAVVRPFDDPSVGCVAGELQHGPVRTAAQRQAARMLGHWQRFATSSNPPFVVTANAAFRRHVFEEIGYFDSRFPKAQDVELSLRFNSLTDLRIVYCAEAVARHIHRRTQLGFFRQQFGWAYGAGLIGARDRARTGRPSDPPRLRDVGTATRGVWLVLAELARGRGRPEYLEDAWFGLLRQLAWWSGGWAGLLRGARMWRRQAADNA